MSHENPRFRAEPQRPPSAVNHYRADLLIAMLDSYAHHLGRPLLVRLAGESATEWALRAYHAPCVLLAHDGAAEPAFVYANRTAQRLFDGEWADLVGLKSRYSAEADERASRERLLSRVLRDGWCDDYAGVRVARSGRRFRIEGATVWNVLDSDGRPLGQAATFAQWADILH